MATEVEFAFLCSAATYRDGLLSVLEAGLETFRPMALPAVIEPWLVFKVGFEKKDITQTQLVRAFVELDDETRSERERIADVGFSVQATPRDPDALTISVVAIHRMPMQIRKGGVYALNLTLNGDLRRRIPFSVERTIPQV